MGATIVGRYVTAGVVLASLFYLVLVGKMSPADYETLAVGALGALGGYHAGRFSGGKEQ
jgi:hypothetical protein